MDKKRIAVGKEKGPTVAITYGVHGNEIVGKDTVQLLETYFKGRTIKKGQLISLCINPEACKKGKRYIDHDMNRIRGKKYQTSSLEFERREIVKPILDTCDIVIDLHSTSQASQVMLITDSASIQANFFDVDVQIVDDTQKTGAMISYLIGQNKPAYGLELGMHDDPLGKHRGLRNIINLLSHYDMVETQSEKKLSYQGCYKILEELVAGDNNFRLSKSYKNHEFTIVKPGQMYGSDETRTYVNTYQHDIYLGMIAKVINKGQSIGLILKKV